MPVSVPVPTKNPGDVLTSTLWNSYLRDNINKMVNLGHRVLTVAQFAALTGLEDGDECYLEVDGTNGVEWHIRYTSAEATYKWRFLGGPPLYSVISTDEAISGLGAWLNCTTVGADWTAVRSGDYIAQFSCRAQSPAGGAATSHAGVANASVSTTPIGPTVTADSTAASKYVALAGKTRLPGITSGQVIRMEYFAVTNLSLFGNRVLFITPVRLI